MTCISFKQMTKEQRNDIRRQLDEADKPKVKKFWKWPASGPTGITIAVKSYQEWKRTTNSYEFSQSMLKLMLDKYQETETAVLQRTNIFIDNYLKEEFEE